MSPLSRRPGAEKGLEGEGLGTQVSSAFRKRISREITKRVGKGRTKE